MYMVLRSVELNLADRFLIYAMVHRLLPVEFSWFNNNNSATIKDMKNLSPWGAQSKLGAYTCSFL